MKASALRNIAGAFLWSARDQKRGTRLPCKWGCPVFTQVNTEVEGGIEFSRDKRKVRDLWVTPDDVLTWPWDLQLSNHQAVSTLPRSHRACGIKALLA